MFQKLTKKLIFNINLDYKIHHIDENN